MNAVNRLLVLCALCAAPTPTLRAADDPIPQGELIELGLQRELLACAEGRAEALEKLVPLTRSLREVAEISHASVAEVEADSLRAKSEVILRRAEFEIRLDQVSTKFAVKSGQAEEQSREIFAPLRGHFERLQSIREQFQSATDAMNALELERKPGAAREAVLRVLGDSKILKGTEVWERFSNAFQQTEPLSAEELQGELSKLHRQEKELLDNRTNLLRRGEPVPDERSKEMESIYFSAIVLDLERLIRAFERTNPDSDRGLLPVQLRNIRELVSEILSAARQERHATAAESWPKFEGISVESNNLLELDPADASAVVNRLLPDEGRALMARSRLTRLRAQAAVYQNRQQEYQIAMTRVNAVESDLLAPPPPGVAVSVGDLSSQLLTAQRSLIGAKERLFETWAAYHRERHALAALLKK